MKSEENLEQQLFSVILGMKYPCKMWQVLGDGVKK